MADWQAISNTSFAPLHASHLYISVMPFRPPVAELVSDSEGDIIGPEFIIPAVFRADSDSFPTEEECFGERELEGTNNVQDRAGRMEKHCKLASEAREGSSKLSPVKGMQMLNLREDQVSNSRARFGIFLSLLASAF